MSKKALIAGQFLRTASYKQKSKLLIKNNKDIQMIDFREIKFNKLRITYKTIDGVESSVRGRKAQTLCWLCKVGDKGITSLEMGSWAIRLAAYIGELKHKHKINIRTIDEPHDGGVHGRYVLQSAVDILEVTDLSSSSHADGK